MYLYLLSCVLLALVGVNGDTRSVWDEGFQPSLREVLNWSQLDFQFPSQVARNQAIANGNFVANLSMVPIGVAAAGDRIFLAIPRWRSGVPATLAYVRFPSNTTSPLLVPYPSWELNRLGSGCNSIVSTLRVKVDECNRLWLVDSGVAAGRKYCNPKVTVIDLNTDRILQTLYLPSGALKEDSSFANIEVEYPNGTCGRHNDAVLYIADNRRFALIVYDLKANKAWRVTDKTMYPSPEEGTIYVAGENFELMDGVIGLALGPKSNTSAGRTLYFSALTSNQQYWVNTSVLRNESLANNSPTDFIKGSQPRPGQSAGYDMDKNGILFFGLVNRDALACWNTRKTFDPTRIARLAQNNDTMQFISTVSVDQSQRLWALSSRYHKYFLRTMDPTEINFRIFMAESTTDLIKGTVCMSERCDLNPQ
ncbi:protein yellow-like [Cloeon dipterum]|uniref:protein yellow-like n=1 Tax=Cloeon dipterum TaxID=197152 RepID=UPI00321FE010